jgi:hypothetical protein
VQHQPYGVVSEQLEEGGDRHPQSQDTQLRQGVGDPQLCYAGDAKRGVVVGEDGEGRGWEVEGEVGHCPDGGRD